MVRFYSKTHEYPEPTPTPLLAFFLRYPNPFARHVLSVDVLSRRLDASGRLHTTRLILKRGVVPAWASKWLPSAASSGGRGLDAWVFEESVVDPPGHAGEGSMPRLVSRQGNLSFKKFMLVIEGGEIVESPTGSTLHHTTAEVTSNFGGQWSSLLRQRIESYGVGKFEGNTELARKGMALVLGLLRDRHLLPPARDGPDGTVPQDTASPTQPPAQQGLFARWLGDGGARDP
ncbi:PRELI domain-containing protein 1, mitochondrial [Cryptotrichosporon argae]